MEKKVTVSFEQFFTDQMILSMISKNRKHLWLIAAPKSGSTWLSTLILNLLKWPRVELVPAFERREQEIDLRRLVFHRQESIFSPHQHCQISQYTFNIIKKANITPILQIRNLFDTVLSMKDHFDKENTILPMAFMKTDQWNCFSEHQKLNFIIEMVLPWFVNFYAGWFSSELYKNGEIFVSSYESLKENTPNHLKKLMNWISENKDNSEILKTIDTVRRLNTRKNKAIVGRGGSLTNEHKDKIKSYKDFYPDIDFSLIGL